VPRIWWPTTPLDSPDVFLRDRINATTSKVSIASDGGQANHGSGQPALSADGHDVAFFSHASNLVPDDTNGRGDMFVQHNS
jgi:hypothetical protein